jgi:ATP-dependent DNA helicase RecG
MPAQISANSPVTNIPLVGPSKAELLDRLGIRTVKDLLFHIPFKYRDTSEIITIEELKEKKSGTILAQVRDIKNAYTRSRKVITKAVVHDATGRINIIWFNQGYLTKSIKIGEYYLFEGKIPDKPGAKDLSFPSYERFLGDVSEQTHIGKLTPYYSETEGISSKWLRSRINFLKKDIKEMIDDLVPSEFLDEYEMPHLNEAVYSVHFPGSEEEINKGRERLGFDEMLAVALDIEKERREQGQKKGIPLNIDVETVKPFLESLPFSLTNDQVIAIKEILEDMNKDISMRRLLNGDVGSGKTAVAAAAAFGAHRRGYTTLIMAPTTILAQQHFNTLSTYLEPLGVPVTLKISGSGEIAKDTTGVIIGTHALLHQDILPEDIGLLVVDEQHRFGVKQRRELLKPNRKGIYPHYLTMSATPIPRTLTNVLFGDMEVSFIREMPVNRLPVKTHYVPQAKRDSCLEWVRDRIIGSEYQEQAFIIFPLVEESEKLEAKSAKKEYDRLTKEHFKDLKVGLIHGQLKPAEKEKVLADFKKKKYSVLVATPVVEVGIDITDATMIVIENAERFGLAQLHQFRGRVGRGDKQSYCYVIAGEHMQGDESAIERLKYFSSHNSGFDVAEYDLQSRGPGEVYGLRQSGIPAFKVASITDIKLLIKCRDVAKGIFTSYPDRVELIKQGLFK